MSQIVRLQDRTDRGPSGRLWQGCPWEALVSLNNPDRGWAKGDDFISGDAGAYTLTVIGSGSAALAMSSAHDGVLVANTGATTTDKGFNLNPGSATAAFVTPSASRTIWLETLIKLTTISTAPASFFGLATQALGLGTDGLVSGTNYIGFLSTATNTVKFAYLETGDTEYLSSALTVKTTTAYTTAEWVKLGFRIEGLRAVVPYINGVEQTPIVATDARSLPFDVMNVDWSVICKGTVQPVLSIDWWRCACLENTTATVAIA